jgi:histidyl-tRNA synthetase
VLCTRLLAVFRQHGAYSDMAFRGNLKKRMQRADAAGAAYVVIVGEDELANNEMTIRSLKSGEQIRRKIDDGLFDKKVGRNFFLAMTLSGLDGIKAPA